MSSTTFRSTKTAKCFHHLLSYLPPLPLSLIGLGTEKETLIITEGDRISRENDDFKKKSVRSLWWSYTLNETVALKYIYLTILHIGIGQGNVTTRFPSLVSTAIIIMAETAISTQKPVLYVSCNGDEEPFVPTEISAATGDYRFCLY